MNILIFTQNYPKSYNEAIISGMIKNPFYLSQTLKKAGHNVTVITSGDKPGEWTFDKVRVHCVGRGILKGVIHAFVMELKMFIKFLSLYKKEQLDVIRIHQLNVLPIIFLRKMKFIKCPVIYIAHGTSIPELKASFKGFSPYKVLLYANAKVQCFIDKISWKLSDVVISTSRFQIEEMENIYKVPKDKIACIYNGVDNTHYFPNSEAGKQLRQRMGISSDIPVVLYVGRIARKKGIHLLIKSAKNVIKELPATRFILVTGNIGRQLDYKKEFLRLVEQENLGNHMIVRENVPEKDLPAYYNAADICVFPSTGYESIPSVILEAMACGKPIITQGNWGITEVLTDVLLTEEALKDDDTLSDNILKILKNEDYREKLSNNNLQVAQNFSWEAMSKKHLILNEQIIKKPNIKI